MRLGFISLACAAWLWPSAAFCAPAEVQTPSGVAMIPIPAGSFMMGDEKGGTDQKPAHKVSVSSFYMDKYKVTQEEYEAVMGENPSLRKGGKNPVENLRWSDAVRYCNARSQRDGLRPCYNLETWECDFGADGYRLPTEAEWEYACRGGTQTRFFFGDDGGKLPSFAWFKDNAAGRTHAVGQKLPNPWGLCDICGNVFEWCNDFYQADYYQKSVGKDPQGPRSGDKRVVRGGCWNSTADQCRSAARNSARPGYMDTCIAGYDVYGFRVVRRAAEKPAP